MTKMISENAGHIEPIKRFGEPAKFLPVAFILSIIVGLYLIYTFAHLAPLVQTPSTYHRAVVEFVIFNITTALLVFCYLHAILVHPGTIPEKDEDSSWDFAPQEVQTEGADGNLQETKRSGDRRQCKWCVKYKPDRCHHCRVCRMCILKMDHHCPWIYNCVGFYNHKYFFLLIMYSTIDCHIILWTMLDSVVHAVSHSTTPFMKMFVLLFGETLAAFFGFLVTGFFLFHVWLTYKGLTTIEFCEKSTKSRASEGSAYDYGTMANFKSVLGDNPFLWLVPCSLPSGNGLTYLKEEAKLTPTMEAGRGLRRKMHQKSYGTNTSASAAAQQKRRAGDAIGALARPEAPEEADAEAAEGAGALPNSERPSV